MKTIKTIITVLIVSMLCQFADAQCPAGKVRMARGSKGHGCQCSPKCVNQADVATYQANGWYLGDCAKFCFIGWRSSDVLEVSSQTSLTDIYPNPTTGSTTVFFSVSQTQKVSFTLIDVTGRLVTSLGEEVYEAGENEFLWNAENMPSGIYFLRMATESYSALKKVSVVN